MPEANVLYSVTAAVVVGLVAWVAVVLKSAKEPWARETPKAARTDDVPIEGMNEAKSDEAKSDEAKSDEAKSDEPTADAKADAKPEPKPAVEAKPEAKVDAEAKPDAKADDSK